MGVNMLTNKQQTHITNKRLQGFRLRVIGSVLQLTVFMTQVLAPESL